MMAKKEFFTAAKRAEEAKSERQVSNYGHGTIETKHGNRTIYVQDVERYKQWQEQAEQLGISVSEMIWRAMVSYTTESKACPVCERQREILKVGIIGTQKVKGKK